MIKMSEGDGGEKLELRRGRELRGGRIQRDLCVSDGGCEADRNS